MAQRKLPEELRSHRWFGADDLRSFAHRSRAKQMGYALEDFQGKPVIAIINTWSDLSTCHSHFRTRAEEVKRGVWQAGGFPVELPAMSVTETYMKPSPMMYRNFLAMETEELLRSQPIDGAVLMGGCDKTTPGLLMGAISMNLPAIYLPAGPMLRGNWNGQVLGQRQRRLEILGGKMRRQHQRLRMVGDGRRHRAFARTLHDDGHGFDDDGDRRNAGTDLAGRVIDSGGRRQSFAHGHQVRPPHRGDGLGRFEAARYPDRRFF